VRQIFPRDPDNPMLVAGSLTDRTRILLTRYDEAVKAFGQDWGPPPSPGEYALWFADLLEEWMAAYALQPYERPE
jgi:hypothetical protein